MKKLNCVLLIVTFLMLFLLSSCGKGKNLSLLEEPVTVEGATNYVQLEMENGGKIVIELYPDIAPVSVSNFQNLVSQGFYDGLTFHRVVSNFVIQCGSPSGDGADGASTKIVGEFAANGHTNTLYHTRGVVSMGRLQSGYDTASSHFFICLTDQPQLDGYYAAFGRVIEGMDVVDAIAAVPVDKNDRPLEDQIVKKASFVVREE